MYPSSERPALGSFVRDQVQALRRLAARSGPESGSDSVSASLSVDVFAFDPGGSRAYGRAARELRRRYRGERFDVVHAHYGLTSWPAMAVQARVRAVTLHGTDLAHPRARPVTLAALPLLDLVATVSQPLASRVPRWAARRPVAVLPCGVELARFKPIPRAQARAALGLAGGGPYTLFAADPRRAEKRYDRALSIAGATPLLTLVDVEPAVVPLWINAANAVLVPSDREGFGLAVLEALACDVPVLATPVGVAPAALEGIAGAYCGPFDEAVWRHELERHLGAADPRIAGRRRAEEYSTDLMAARVLDAWRDALAAPAWQDVCEGSAAKR
jgi:glycosyltransferase involved in cell wall biosynthesis